MTDGGSGSGDVRRDDQDQGQGRDPATFGAGPSGDVPPAAVAEVLPRRGRNTRNHRARRASASAPFPWVDGNPSAPFRDQAQIDGVRRALRFVVDVRQKHLEQGLRDELTSRQISYLQHCLASLWEDSASESSGGSELEMPQIAGVQERACYAADVRPAASAEASSSSGPAPAAGSAAASAGRPERVSWADASGDVPNDAAPERDGGASPTILPSPVHPSRGMEREEDDTTPTGSTASVQEQDAPEMEPEPAPEEGGRPPRARTCLYRSSTTGLGMFGSGQTMCSTISGGRPSRAQVPVFAGRSCRPSSRGDLAVLLQREEAAEAARLARESRVSVQV